ncbi:hypothetical protein E2C01_090805 [Portunus trituberculatus]|uniref:Uncharacterized protein n=1 Tax=Portunus trituberculatus TaxID=210409 RepID=A0A5B7JR46_PORTR|nr:hypothetical protein [Portunus trituberculatus]
MRYIRRLRKEERLRYRQAEAGKQASRQADIDMQEGKLKRKKTGRQAEANMQAGRQAGWLGQADWLKKAGKRK